MTAPADIESRLSAIEARVEKATDLRLNAYYYGFSATGHPLIDIILSAVACAGKAYHHTDNWNEEIRPYEEAFQGSTCAEWIQRAAEDAAFMLVQKDREIAGLITQLRQCRREAFEEAAKIADEKAASENAAGARAYEAGRFGVSTCRDAGMESAADIAKAIRARALQGK